MSQRRNASLCMSVAFVAVTLSSPMVARAPMVLPFASSVENGNHVITVANKIQKALKALKKPFKKAPKVAPAGPAKQPSLNQIPGGNVAAAPNVPQRAPSQAASSNSAQNPYGVIPPPRQTSVYDKVEAPQFPNGPYGEVPAGRLNQRPAGNNAYGSANVNPNGPYGNIPRGQNPNGPYGVAPPPKPASQYDLVGAPQFPNGPYANVPKGQFPNGAYGNVPRGQFPNGAYGNVPRGQFPNGPYGNVPNGQQAGVGANGYAPVDPSIFRNNSNGLRGETSPGYGKFDTSLFKNTPDGLPAQIRRLPTQRFDGVVPANSPAQVKQLDELKALEKGLARDGKIIKGAAVGIVGSGLVLGGLGTAKIVDMSTSSDGEQSNE